MKRGRRERGARSRAWSRVLAGAIVLGGAGCAWQPPEMEEKEIPTGYRGEARVRPFLAATRFLEAMGLTVLESFSLVEMPGENVAILLPSEGDRTSSSAERLRQWVSEGGHAIYLLEGGDSFQNDFAADARWEEEGDEVPTEETGGTKGTEGSDRPGEAPEKDVGRGSLEENRVKPGGEPVIEGGTGKGEAPAKGEPGKLRKGTYPFLEALGVEVVGREKAADTVRIGPARFRAEIPPGKGFRVPREMVGQGQIHGAGARAERALVSFPLGRGRVTLVADARLWRNRYIGEGDHAALLWEVARLGQRPEAVWMVRSTKVTLFALIWQYGRRVLISLGLLLVVWLWWATRRFGPRLQDPETGSREFAQHLEMSGNFLWRRKAAAALVEPVRRRLRARHTLHESGHREGWGPETLAQLARQSGLDEAALARALFGEVPREARKLTELLRHLQLLDNLS